MKIVPEWHYLVKINNGSAGRVWATLCYKCLYDRRNIGDVNTISYSALGCALCGAVHVTPFGVRPPFKMREVTYQIKAS